MTDRNVTYKRLWKVVNLAEGMAIYVPPDDNLNLGSIPSSIDPYSESSAQLFPLGTRLEWGEEVYRYAKCGAVAVEIAALCQAVVPLAGHINEAINTPAVGDVTIAFTPAVLTTDDLAANELAQGYIYIYDNTGEGAKYRIKSHPAILGAASGVLTLYDPIRIAPIAASVATVVHNKFRNFIIHDSPPTAAVVGVTVAPVTANYYCWLQTKGPACILVDGTLVMGGPVRASEDDDGAVAQLDRDEAQTVDEMEVGMVLDIGADAAGGAATYGFIDLKLD